MTGDRTGRARRLGIRSGIAVPIIDNEKEVIAFFEVYNKKDGGFTDADLEHSLAAARIGSLAIHNRQLYRNLSALAAFSQSLTVTSDFDQILEVVGDHIETNFNQRSIILLPANGGLTARFRSTDCMLSELNSRQPLGRGTRTRRRTLNRHSVRRRSSLCAPEVRGQVIGVLGLEVKTGAWFSNVQRQLFSAFVSQSALAIERGVLEQKVQRLRFIEESDKVQNAVLTAISHDVNAPLAAITASLSGLLTSDGALDQAAERQLLETADIEARRLHRLVNNLLSMTRLETGASTVKTEPSDLFDVVSTALEELGRRRVSDKSPLTFPKTCLRSTGFWFDHPCIHQPVQQCFQVLSAR